jgi:hypothetical protein
MHSLVAAVILWNTRYLEAASGDLAQGGIDTTPKRPSPTSATSRWNPSRFMPDAPDRLRSSSMTTIDRHAFGPPRHPILGWQTNT